MARAQQTPAPTDQAHGPSAVVVPGSASRPRASTAEAAWEPTSTCRVRRRRLRVPPTKSEGPHRPPASRARPSGAALTGASAAPGGGALSPQPVVTAKGAYPGGCRGHGRAVSHRSARSSNQPSAYRGAVSWTPKGTGPIAPAGTATTG